MLDRIEPQVKALIHQVEQHSDYRQPGVADDGVKAKSVPAAKATTQESGSK